MTTSVYLNNLMLDVKNMRVKHVRKMFVYLREMGTELGLHEMKDRTDWASFEALNNKLKTVVVEHGITLGEFATGYVLNIQSRQRNTVEEAQPVPTPASTEVKEEPGTKRKRPQKDGNSAAKKVARQK